MPNETETALAIICYSIW